MRNFSKQDLAHERYAGLTVSFMVTQQGALFDEAVVQEWQARLDQNKEFTEKFLVPFQQVALLEYSKSEDGVEKTPWMETGKSKFNCCLNKLFNYCGSEVCGSNPVITNVYALF